MIQFVLQVFRGLIRRPRYGLSFVLPLALALAGTCVMVSLVRGVILEPLPFREPDRLVEIWERNLARGNDQTSVAVADYYDLKTLSSFSSVAGYLSAWEVAMVTDDGARHVRIGNGTYNLFDTLGVAPLAGRLYTASEEEAGEDVLVASDDFAVEMFGSAQAAVGQTIVLQDTPCLIIGVVDSNQALPVGGIDFYSPTSHSEQARENRKSHVLMVVGRLAPGVSMSEAQAELDVLMGRIRREFSEEKTGEHAFLVPLHDEIVGEVRQPLVVLGAAVGILLLIAIANVSGLAIARARSRATELAVRRSLGASTWRASSPLLVETVALCVVAGLLAVAAAGAGLRATVAAISDWVPRVGDVRLEPVDVAVCLGFALTAALLVGLATAVISFRSQGVDSLRGAGRTGMTVTRDRLRATAVVAQVAMSFVLLSGASVLVRSMVGIITTDPGYRTGDVLTAEVDLPGSRYGDIETQNAFFGELVDRVRGLPGVVEAAATSSEPVTGSRITRSFLLESDEVVVEGARPTYPYLAVTPGYFETMSIPVLRGRPFNSRDTVDSPGVIIVNEAFAKKESLGREMLGRRLSFAGSEGPWLEVVGVVADTRDGGLEAEPEPRFFVPNTQRTWSWLTWMTLVVRTDGDPAALVGPLRGVIRSMEPSIAVDEVLTVEQHIHAALGKKRFQLFLVGLFASLALILTVVGIYALITNALAMRTREIGVRLALGAGPRDVVRIFAREGLTLVAVGIGIGLALSAIAMRFLEAMVVRVSPNDPLSVSAAVVLILAVTGLSCYLPSRRASGVDPAVVLKAE